MKHQRPQKTLRPYWPLNKFEDYSDQRDQINRLTPYNLLYIEKLNIQGRDVYVPRRCMHCFDAPCRKLCPFGAIDRTKQGAIQINHKICFGGAKCRDVCPWEIPQRQAGVGLYLDIVPKFAGGGLMYKCDLCATRLAKNQKPACVDACPQQAMISGSQAEMTLWLEHHLNGRHLYGRAQNGGTATWYVSSISFDTLDKAMTAKLCHEKSDGRGRPGFPDAPAELTNTNILATATLAVPVVAVGSALLLRRRNNKKETT